MSTTSKANFSGPAEIIEAAIKASALKFGDRNGSWSRWVVEALTEKLQAENPDLLETIKALANVRTPAVHAELLHKLTHELKVRPDLASEVEQLLAASPRRRRAAVAAN